MWCDYSKVSHHVSTQGKREQSYEGREAGERRPEREKGRQRDEEMKGRREELNKEKNTWGQTELSMERGRVGKPVVLSAAVPDLHLEAGDNINSP